MAFSPDGGGSVQVPSSGMRSLLSLYPPRWHPWCLPSDIRAPDEVVCDGRSGLDPR